MHAIGSHHFFFFFLPPPFAWKRPPDTETGRILCSFARMLLHNKTIWVADASSHCDACCRKEITIVADKKLLSELPNKVNCNKCQETASWNASLLFPRRPFLRRECL
ncbi:unnamed protein product [Ixodes pacificus]